MMLLVIALLATIAVHVHTSLKLRRAEYEAASLRNELGYLTISDPDQIHETIWEGGGSPGSTPNTISAFRSRSRGPTGWKRLPAEAIRLQARGRLNQQIPRNRSYWSECGARSRCQVASPWPPIPPTGSWCGSKPE